jgi:hypothetical protein
MKTEISEKHTEKDGAIRAQIQDNSSDPIIIKLLRFKTSTAFVSGVIGSRTVVLAAGHGAVAGDTLQISQFSKTFQAGILVVATNTLTLDTPLDFDFNSEATTTICTSNMAVNGSVTPVAFCAKPPPGARWDLYGISTVIVDGTSMDDGTFGGIAALTNGIVIRKLDGTSRVFANLKSNGEMALFFEAFIYADRAPSGVYSVRGRSNIVRTNGVAVRIASNEEFQIVIQDDLTGLTSFSAIIAGHIVE